jgi:hypothetical protein
LEPIKLTGEYTFDEYKKSLSFSAEIPRWAKIIYTLSNIIFWSQIGIFLLIYILTGIWKAAIPMLIFSGILLGMRYVFIPKLIRKNFYEDRIYQSPFEIEITDDYVTLSNQTSQSKRDWEVFKRWRENQDQILLFPQGVPMLINPKRLFKSEKDGEKIKKLLTENSIPEYGGPLKVVMVISIFYIVFSVPLLNYLIKIFQSFFSALANNTCHVLSTLIRYV